MLKINRIAETADGKPVEWRVTFRSAARPPAFHGRSGATDKTRVERAERENKPELVKALTEAVEMAKRLRRASPAPLASQDQRRAAAGYLNERGQPFNPNSVRLMLEG